MNIDATPDETLTNTKPANIIVTSAQMGDLFNSTNTGKSVLEVYKNSTFQRAHRQTIAEIVIRNELEGQPDKRISGTRFMELSEMIVELFPTEYKVSISLYILNYLHNNKYFGIRTHVASPNRLFFILEFKFHIFYFNFSKYTFRKKKLKKIRKPKLCQKAN